ncbi:MULTISPECIES: hypothetical protein [unclassified Janthinobacterium]|uniref:P-loop NTPase n=1 Tax=unclassified Janthinobacterium TaxID=2610881 RepID=UPI001617DC7A|nr:MULTISPECIES: hypothetical protein [unclassified Janthinobacterium]MBB5606068.1 hypothetical protein [Janthinobacterium sp. S3T4]MBB5616027.1 hypothetical protein [Janthinobacterium sp. S3M3]
MNEIEKKNIKEVICPLILSGEAALLLGEHFSRGSSSLSGTIPNADELKNRLLNDCGKTPGSRTTLKDAYKYAERNIPNFSVYFSKIFSATKTSPWQDKIFEFVWNRIYTTNIDNSLNLSYSKVKKNGKNSADFVFLNYSDNSIIGSSIGSIPVISINGSIEFIENGFLLDNSEYGSVDSRKISDWHNELPARMLIGGLIVIGELDENDIDACSTALVFDSKDVEHQPKNWVILNNPDEIKCSNYKAAGFVVIDSTPEEFFNFVYLNIAPVGIYEAMSKDVPAEKKSSFNIKAMVWFRSAFNTILNEIEKAKLQAGILRQFIMGAYPDWFYIQNNVHAVTPKIESLTRKVAYLMSTSQDKLGVLHVTGSSGSGKTTGIRASLHSLVNLYPYIYEFDSENGIDIEYLYSILDNFSEKSIIVFYSAAAYYYTVNALAIKLKDKPRPFVLFILEERTNSFLKNRHHLVDCATFATEFEFGRMSIDDAKAVAKKLDSLSIIFEGFSNNTIDQRAKIILDSERGYNGDLLSTLFSLTTHENFEDRIYKEYHSVAEGSPRDILEVTAIMSSLGFSIPINYMSGFLEIEPREIMEKMSHDLMGIAVMSKARMQVMCRHRVIADFYFKNCIAGKGNINLVVGILEFLSRQFTIADIRYHPLAYEIYRKIISFNFLYDDYFPKSSRRKDTERTYHEAQRFFGTDGVFWLQFGRFYRKIGEFDNAIDCFRTGLMFYDSFQTRHSLGTALLEKFVATNCLDEDLYAEGVAILDEEIIRRGPRDPYPTTTMCKLLLDIMQVRPSNTDVNERFLSCMNNGLKNFKDDITFQRIIKRYYSMSER